MDREYFESKQDEAIAMLNAMFGDQIDYCLMMVRHEHEEKTIFFATGGNMSQEQSMDLMRAQVQLADQTAQANPAEARH